TMGLLIASWLSAKSSQMKSITKLATVPGIFNINEPVIFGLPIVFNPFLLIPFVLVPLLAIVITYISIAIGFMSPFSAVQIPWTTPPIIAGLLLNGWQGAVVQIIVIAMSTAVYFPFVRAQDKKMLAEEQGEENSESQNGEQLNTTLNEEEANPALHN
ncbi:MAG: PTS sugar transporter subunit IIC, partial [Selenomonas sp.]|nr:PTS sugar transporter subunit IIC [Selenomonas sp.]